MAGIELSPNSIGTGSFATYSTVGKSILVVIHALLRQQRREAFYCTRYDYLLYFTVPSVQYIRYWYYPAVEVNDTQLVYSTEWRNSREAAQPL